MATGWKMHAGERFDRVADLVEGFETAYGLKLLSTVHWVYNVDGALPVS
ncbi:MAG: hypothetical protein OXQ89_11225 [Rhodospirillaceae bacterium]|nr:hypothetical protein [Rhodospirillaceae bacterium]